MKPELIKAARELLGWTQGELATKARLGHSTVADYERKGRQHTWKSTIEKMVKALEKGGVKFLLTGVELHQRAKK